MTRSEHAAWPNLSLCAYRFFLHVRFGLPFTTATITSVDYVLSYSLTEIN